MGFDSPTPLLPTRRCPTSPRPLSSFGDVDVGLPPPRCPAPPPSPSWGHRGGTTLLFCSATTWSELRDCSRGGESTLRGSLPRVPILGKKSSLPDPDGLSRSKPSAPPRGSPRTVPTWPTPTAQPRRPGDPCAVAGAKLEGYAGYPAATDPRGLDRVTRGAYRHQDRGAGRPGRCSSPNSGRRSRELMAEIPKKGFRPPRSAELAALGEHQVAGKLLAGARNHPNGEFSPRRTPGEGTNTADSAIARRGIPIRDRSWAPSRASPTASRSRIRRRGPQRGRFEAP
jgi:hypothetical protein